MKWSIKICVVGSQKKPFQRDCSNVYPKQMLKRISDHFLELTYIFIHTDILIWMWKLNCQP